MEALASFRVTIPGQETPVNALGLWQVAAEEATTGDQAGSLWRAELPGEPVEAGQALDFQEAQLGRVRLALGTVESRLSADLKNLPGPDAAADYALRATALLEAEPGSPSSVLATAAQTRWPETSYAVLDRLPLDTRQLEEAGQAVGRFATQVQQTVSQFARVETVIGGRMVGVTRVAWSGEVETRWSARLIPAAHARVGACPGNPPGLAALFTACDRRRGAYWGSPGERPVLLAYPLDDVELPEAGDGGIQPIALALP
jgi:hypothetical protein